MIDVEKVRFTYDGNSFALDGVTLHVAAGEFVCILGGNGSGKSTLARHMDALLVPDEGRVSVCGLDTADPEYVYDIRSRVGLVFQNPDDQLIASLVEDDVAFGPENLGIESAEIARRLERALADVGLMGFEHHETHALSGGQKQRVALAGVLAMHPAALVLDEASSMLDPRGRSGLMKVCRELHEAGMTIIMITHYMEEAALADRVVVLRDGRSALEGTPQEVLTQVERLHELNLEVPASCQLGMCLHQLGLPAVAHVDEAAMVDEVVQLLSPAGAGVPAGTDPEPASSTAPSGIEASSVGGGADAPSSREEVISFEHVSYSYEPSVRERDRRRRRKRAGRRAKWGNAPDAVWALHNVDLSVYRGELLGLAGHTGSGKSTLIQHMNGLVHPTMGRVRAFGRNLADKRAGAAVKTRVGLVFQYPEHQLFAPTVFEDVAFGPRNLGLDEGEVEARVRQSLEQVGLSFDAVSRRSPFALSGGQQRRCALAGVLAMRPEVLVLDEPAAGLDPSARRALLSLISGLHTQGLTVIMSSHSMDDLAELCDRIVIMNEGSVFCTGTPQEVFSRADDLSRIGLGVPAAQRIASSLMDRGVPLQLGRLYTVETLGEDIARLARGGSR